MEVLAGVRDKRDLHTTNKVLRDFYIIDIDQSVLKFGLITKKIFGLLRG